MSLRRQLASSAHLRHPLALPTVTAIAKDAETSVDIVKALYEEECAVLSQQATVKTFIGVIATKNVKRHLRSLGASRGPEAMDSFDEPGISV